MLCIAVIISTMVKNEIRMKDIFENGALKIKKDPGSEGENRASVRLARGIPITS